MEQYIYNKGSVFSSKNRLVSETAPSSVKLYYSTTKQFGRTDTFNLPSGYTYFGLPTITQDYTNKKSTVGAINSSWSSWCLTDENDKILIWCNQNGTALDTIVYYFKYKSSFIKYKY